MEDKQIINQQFGGIFPKSAELFYAGAWHAPQSGIYAESLDPASGRKISKFAYGGADDVYLAVQSAKSAFGEWRKVAPGERGKILRTIAGKIRTHAEELAQLDSLDGGNPVSATLQDVFNAVTRMEHFAGLVTEVKGNTIPFSSDRLNYTQREPLGIVARIVAFNHPFMFSANAIVAPLVTGNVVIVKPPEQAPLSAMRLAELIGDLLPPGTFSLLTGGRELGEALVEHPDVAMVGLVGSVETGKAVMRSASTGLKRLVLELGGKNALIAFPDADPVAVAHAAVRGMNFTWCGQSCGSTSRIFLHDDIHDTVVEHIHRLVSGISPGVPTDPETRMGALINAQQLDRVRNYIEIGKQGGAKLFYGGTVPDDPKLGTGYFLNPTVFVDVTQDMRIAREEIFGPVMSVLRWRDEIRMLSDVNSVPYGLTCSIWTRDLVTAHQTAAAVEAGYIWVNEVSKHFLGAPFGGYKQSGLGREESIEELFAFTQEKNVHVRLDYSM